jgi:hypothetical protein
VERQSHPCGSIAKAGGKSTAKPSANVSSDMPRAEARQLETAGPLYPGRRNEIAKPLAGLKI